jgi:two-component system CheB/CheR fusion protein
MADKKKDPGRKNKKGPAASRKPRTATAKTKAAARTTKKEATKPTRTHPLRVVGMGASAGGLEAFEQFFTHMPADSGMAFVLVPHLAPSYKSIMTEILQKYTKMEVMEAGDGMVVQPNKVYVIPPNKDMAILNGALQLMEPAGVHGQRHPIDFFFRSLAHDQKEKAVSIVLSGTGTEGTLGLREIKGEGGLVMAQDTESAKYDGMPRSAIATNLVDFILPADQMPEHLIKFSKGIKLRERKKPGVSQDTSTDNIHKVFILIRNHTGHDFSHYKKSTIIRRIERRMTVHHLGKMADYIRYLRENPHEIEMLFKEILIRVTHFFREPESYDALKTKVLPSLFKNKSYDQLVRIWVPGCCTGEEAYSLAMLFLEYMKKIKENYSIQIFATDLDHEAIEMARAGLYPNTLDVDVSQERLKRFFIKKDSSYKIKDEVRDLVVFADQNLVKDPPFSRMDLISCKNLLIYMEPDLQKKLLSNFYYSLNPGGILALGASESIGDLTDVFSVIDKKWKIFELKDKKIHYRPARLGPPALDASQISVRRTRVEHLVRAEKVDIDELTRGILLESFTPPCVIINKEGDILYIHGRTGKYLEPAPGKARLNIFEMARSGLKLELRATVRKAIHEGIESVLVALEVKTNGETHSCKLVVKPLKEPAALLGLIMVVFEDLPRPKEETLTRGKSRMTDKTRRHISELETELKATREHLQTNIEELETTNEELQSSNEELQSANEELQSTNEELETSKEELQSVNEELVTVNAELQNKNDELSIASNDMANLLSSTRIASIFLDDNLCIKQFTPAATKIINLIETDRGRPIHDIVSKLKYKSLKADCANVLKTLGLKEKEVQDESGHWYFLRIMPYRTLDNVIDGVVLTFSDITSQKKVQDDLRDKTTYAENIVETIREPLLILDNEFTILSANRSFYKTFRVTEKETAGQHLYELGNQQWKIPALKDLMENILPEKKSFDNFKVEHDFPSIGRKVMLLSARRIRQVSKGREMILLAFQDTTEKKPD